MLQKVVERKKHYQDLSGKRNFVLEDIKILKHRDIPNAYFFNVRFSVGDGGIYTDYEVLETLDENEEWIDIKNDLNRFEYGAFLGDCEVCNF